MSSTKHCFKLQILFESIRFFWSIFVINLPTSSCLLALQMKKKMQLLHILEYCSCDWKSRTILHLGSVPRSHCSRAFLTADGLNPHSCIATDLSLCLTDKVSTTNTILITLLVAKNRAKSWCTRWNVSLPEQGSCFLWIMSV